MTRAGSSGLVAQGLCKSFSSLRGGSAGGSTVEVLSPMDINLAPGRTMAVVGPSGCGKTTLLYLLCGLLTPDAGSVSVNGGPVTRGSGGKRGELGIILQDYGLLPWKSVLDNVALGLKLAGVSKRERHERAGQLLTEMGLAGRESAYPATLSGGEAQRVAIARAYALDPAFLLMDEPFSSLDALTREKLQATLLATWRERGDTGYVLVTHSVEEAVYLGQSILLLAGKPARIGALIENPGFGQADHRESETFYATVREVRAIMESLW